MTRHTYLSPICGEHITVVDVEEEKRRRSRLFTRAAWYEIKETLKRITSRTRADRDCISSFMAVFGIALMAGTAAIA